MALLKEHLHYSDLEKIIEFIILNLNPKCFYHLVNFNQRYHLKVLRLEYPLLDFSILLPHFRPFMIMIAKEYPKINLKA